MGYPSRRTGPCAALLLWVAAAVTQQAYARVTCELHFQGDGSSSGLRTAKLSCTGGTLTAAAHPSLLVPTIGASSGVQWSNKGDCGTWKNKCVLTVCSDTKAAFLKARVTNVKVPSTTGLICLGDSSDVLFDHATFLGNTGRSLTVVGSKAKLWIKSSNFLNNTVLGSEAQGGGLCMQAGTGIVEGSTFLGNSVQYYAGAVAVTGDAYLSISNSVFEGNSGK